MQGKTAAEVAAISRQLAQLAQQALLNQPVHPQQPQQPYQPQVQQPPQLAPDDYVTGAHLQNLVPQVAQTLATQAQQYADPAIQGMARLTYDAVKQRNAEVFAKYGHEIDAHLASLPKTQWNIDSLGMVVDVVRGKHVDEIAAERAQRLAAQPNDPALRATGTTGTTPAPTTTDPLAVLSDTQRQQLARQGLALRDIEAFCAKQDPPMPVGKWIERYGKSAIGGGA